MDKTERLFAIMDFLRRHRRPVTGETIAEEFAVSVRTIYRDIQTLIGLGASIDGEAGIGYLLRPGFFLPPLMFTADELEALVLGARWVEQRPDANLATAAKAALGKIATASPDDLRDRMGDTALWPLRSDWQVRENQPLLGVIRESIRTEIALRIDYTDEADHATERTIWPVAIAYYEEKQLIAAWCTLRQDYRNFRTDRILAARLTTQNFGRRRSAMEKDLETIWQGQREKLRPPPDS